MKKIIFKNRIYKLEYDLMYFSENYWFCLKTKKHGVIENNRAYQQGCVYNLNKM